MPTKQISERKSNLAFAFQELLTAIVRLRFNRQSAPKPDVFRAYMREAYRLSAQEAESNGYQSEYVRIAGHAVIGFLDETVALSQNTAFSSGWISPLTNELFPNAPADSFYRDLENLLSTRDSAETGDTIEVLYLCLLLGYRGILANDGGQELSDFLDKISAKMLHIAGQDSYCPPEAQAQIHAALDPSSLATIHDYPSEDHAFGRPGGEHYSAASAELANLRSMEFFVRHLAGTSWGIAQQQLSSLWDEHVKYEFATRDTEDTLKTMVSDAYVNHVPVMTGGVGHEELREFYSKRFIPQMPPDTAMTPVSRTIGTDRVVDEMVFEFTHTIKMDWMLPGLEPTGKHVKVPLVVIVHFRDGKLAHEHIYWDQASVLAQLGLIDKNSLPVAGAESAEKVLNPKLRANDFTGSAGVPPA